MTTIWQDDRRVVYIPTKGRTHLLKKTLNAWLDQMYEVRLVVEKQEADDYIAEVKKLRQGRNTPATLRLVKLPRNDGGIGYARMMAVNHAAKDGLKTIIMSDDDVRPKAITENGAHDMFLLQEAVMNAKYSDDKWFERPILGCAPLYSFHDSSIALDGLPKRDLADGRKRVFIAHTGLFQRCYALNVELVMRLGNFNPAFTVDKEDNDLILRGINMGLPWTFHTGVWFDSIQARYAPGGIQLLTETIDATRHGDGEDDTIKLMKSDLSEEAWLCWGELHRQWPNWVNDPDMAKKPRVSWAKAHDTSFGNWKKHHALKGGEAILEV